MKSQFNLIAQLQELILTRDEHHRVGDGSHLDQLNDSIDALMAKLDPQLKMLHQRLYAKDHVTVSSMFNGCCSVCGMKLPISQVQAVRLAKSVQLCSSCGRILVNEEEDAPKHVAEKTSRNEPRKNGISRFSAEELMVADLKATDAANAIRELAEKMAANRFVTNPAALVAAAMERENVLSTAMGEGLAFPHVRGVEGGGLTLALGVSKDGIKWDDAGTVVHCVFFSVIPTAVSAFYLRLLASLTETFAKAEGRNALLQAADGAALWKALIKATRHTVK